MSTNDRRPAHEVDLSGAAWRKSSYSSGNGACVEVAAIGSGVAVRDSKDRSKPALLLHTGQWDAFVERVARGSLGQP
ncbi:DUF397 domain-containing protein [Streptomyces sp. UNOB3_S3]|uniref:DUF397 domain-containing protein n=1 Tax=Streptomyces sp. UNOB3_S3 TaxID=2871682 RepID=UPI001E2A6B8E|nr:DUF397 domain-containing protein [Streptomyces sp. UNOB3_S3]MCC3777899.1 DUF397 domain-containing protein [Streptomyces sp. UNOB3_S3]